MLPSIKFQSLATAAQANVPVTFGHVFAPGDLMAGRGLIARAADGSYLPMQVDQKATHADGSVRHAIISGILPALAAGEAQSFQLLDADKRSSVQAFAGAPAYVSATIGGIIYTAVLDLLNDKSIWLNGPVVIERQSAAPFVSAAGQIHPHLMARFAVRDYGSAKRVDVAIENNWAYEPGPQNFVYDYAITVAGQVVDSQTGLTHYNHARWRKVFWTGAAPQVNVQHDTAYLIASKAVPNYDQSAPPAEKVLQQLAALSLNAGPMKIGAATAYMPTTGEHDDIGILPAWQVSHLLSMDSRARDCTMATADGAGSWSMHYRDQRTDRPVSLVNFPTMTIAGNRSDAGYDAFPIPGGDISTPYTHDTAHQPSLAYLPYVLTGDYFYLEEMQFWAMYDTFMSNPNYRDKGSGLVIWDQLRGQGWSLRTLAQAAAFTPDADPLKVDLTLFLKNNLDCYNVAYSNNPDANKLGVPTQGYSIAYENNTRIAPWMDDFFTSAVGHAYDLGFDAAKPLLDWKAKFSVGRMTAPGVCWITGAIYDLTIRDSETTPVYDTLAECYTKRLGDAFMALPCAGPEMASAWGAAGPGDMACISNSYGGWVSNMQPALAYAVDSGIANAKTAWDTFMSRTVKPDYSLGGEFNILPRPTSQPIQGATPMTTYKLSIAAGAYVNQDLAFGTEAPTGLLIEVLALDGITVLGSTSAIPGEIAGLVFDDLNATYSINLKTVNSSGVMGAPSVQTFVPQSFLPAAPPAPTTQPFPILSGLTFTLSAE